MSGELQAIQVLMRRSVKMSFPINDSLTDPCLLGDLCGTSGHPEATAHAALKQWTAAGFPASKLLLGLPLYGYVSNSTATRLSGSLLPTSEGEGEEMNFLEGAHPHSASKDTVHAAADLRGWYGQQIPFNAIVSSGALVKNADGNFGGGGGFTMGKSSRLVQILEIDRNLFRLG